MEKVQKLGEEGLGGTFEDKFTRKTKKKKAKIEKNLGNRA